MAACWALAVSTTSSTTWRLILAPFDSRYLERLGEQFDVIYEAWTETRQLYKPSDLAARLQKEKIVAIVVEGDVLTKEIFSVPSLRIAGVCRNGFRFGECFERSVPLPGPGQRLSEESQHVNLGDAVTGTAIARHAIDHLRDAFT